MLPQKEPLKQHQSREQERDQHQHQRDQKQQEREQREQQQEREQQQQQREQQRQQQQKQQETEENRRRQQQRKQQQELKHQKKKKRQQQQQQREQQQRERQQLRQKQDQEQELVLQQLLRAEKLQMIQNIRKQEREFRAERRRIDAIHLSDSTKESPTEDQEEKHHPRRPAVTVQMPAEILPRQTPPQLWPSPLPEEVVVVTVVKTAAIAAAAVAAAVAAVAATAIAAVAAVAAVAATVEEVPLPPTISSRVPAAKGIQQGFSPPGEALTGHPQPTSPAEVVPREDATAVVPDDMATDDRQGASSAFRRPFTSPLGSTPAPAPVQASPSAAPAASSVTRQLPSGRLMETRSASTNHKVDVEVPTRSDASLRAVAAAPLEYEPAMSSAQVDAVISGGLASRTDKSRTSRDGSGGSGGGRGGSNGSGGGNEGTAACDGKAHLVRTEAETGSIDVDALLAAPEDLAADAVRSAAKPVASEGVLAAPAPKKYMNGDGNGNGDGSGSGNGNGNGNGNGGGNGNESGNENRPGLGDSVTQREPMVPSLFGPSRASPAADAASPDSTATAASAVYGCDEEVAGEWGAGTDSSDALDYRFSPKEDAESTGSVAGGCASAESFSGNGTAAEDAVAASFEDLSQALGEGLIEPSCAHLEAQASVDSEVARPDPSLVVLVKVGEVDDQLYSNRKRSNGGSGSPASTVEGRDAMAGSVEGGNESYQAWEGDGGVGEGGKCDDVGGVGASGEGGGVGGVDEDGRGDDVGGVGRVYGIGDVAVATTGVASSRAPRAFSRAGKKKLRSCLAREKSKTHVTPRSMKKVSFAPTEAESANAAAAHAGAGARSKVNTVILIVVNAMPRVNALGHRCQRQR